MKIIIYTCNEIVTDSNLYMRHLLYIIIIVYIVIDFLCIFSLLNIHFETTRQILNNSETVITNIMYQHRRYFLSYKRKGFFRDRGYKLKFVLNAPQGPDVSKCILMYFLCSITTKYKLCFNFYELFLMIMDYGWMIILRFVCYF